jgi:hypothetical protein
MYKPPFEFEMIMTKLPKVKGAEKNSSISCELISLGKCMVR